MPFDDLRQWIAALERAGQLKRIQTVADPILEVAEITDRVSKSRDAKGNAGGPALLFQNLKGHPGAQLLINQFGSDARMKLAVGVSSYEEIGARIRMFMDIKSPQGFLDKLKMLPLLTEASKFFPRTVPTGPCKEVIQRDNFSLLDFPDSAMLAEGWRSLHHASLRDDARPKVGQAQPRDVPHAGLRRAHRGHALAAPESCRRTCARTDAGCGRWQSRRSRSDGAEFGREHLACRRPAFGKNGRRRGDRDRSRGDFFGDRSGAARDRGIYRLPASCGEHQSIW